MKKVLIILSLFYLSVGFLNAEALVGIKTGLNVSSFYGGQMNDDGTRRGFYVGSFVNLPVTNFLSVQPEFYFTSKGKENTYMIGFTKYKKSICIYYLECPVLFKLKVLDRGTLRYNLLAGPYYSFFAGGISNFPVGSDPVTEDIEYLLNGKVRESDFGFTIGAQLDIVVLDFKSWIVSIDIRHTLGLNPVHTREDELLFLIDQKNKTTSMMVGLAYVI
ncbi:PorT family protein [candidate division WOR-3 bacterium]|nr:PorT family protein [candidate division WOR-3 bacterium]